MTLIQRILCGSLAVLMLISVCACGTSIKNEKVTIAQGEASGNSNTERETKETLDIPDTRYDGQELIIMTRDQAEWSSMSIYAERDQIIDENYPLAEAVYIRNDMVLQNYGVVVKEYKQATSNMLGKVQTEVNAPTGDYQAVVGNVDVGANCSKNALIWDLNSVETSSLDFDKPWWDTRMIDDFTINDRVFFATGDLLTLDNDATFVMMFNKTMVKERPEIPDLYELVTNYEWTFDRLFEYEQMAVEDLDGDGVLAYDSDSCGFALTNDVFISMFYAGGLSVVTREDDDSLAFGLNIERAQNVADSAKRIFAKDYVVNINEVAVSTGAGVSEVGKTCFGDNHALFLGEVLQCVERMRGYDVDFGVIPYPMYDVGQKAYYHMMHITGSVVFIPRSVSEDIEMVASMLEAMAYYSVDTVTKQYYEINLTTKHVKDEQSGPMIDMILESRVCDLAYYYNWGSSVATLVESLKPDSTKSVASSAKSLEAQVNRQIRTTLNKIEHNYTD